MHQQLNEQKILFHVAHDLFKFIYSLQGSVDLRSHPHNNINDHVYFETKAKVTCKGTGIRIE